MVGAHDSDEARGERACLACGGRFGATMRFCPADGTRLVDPADGDGPDPYVGLELAGQFRIERLIGEGSMGLVYRAYQASMERSVAVKLLHRDLSASADLVRRFHREGKVASRLAQPHVVQVFLTGTVPFDEARGIGGELYLVMEYLDGVSLAEALREAGGFLPIERAARIVLQLCDAVAEAHAQGIVHRDLKPDNVMLVRRGADPDFVKVLDFGVARVDRMARSGATQHGLVFGTARYISPEGAEGEAVGPAADVYSIATVLYECLAGRTPFDAPTPVALLLQHVSEPPPPLRSHAPASGLPERVERVVMRALSKDPAHRPADAAAFAKDLASALDEAGLRAVPTSAPAPRASRGKRARAAVRAERAERVSTSRAASGAPATSSSAAPAAPTGGSDAAALRALDEAFGLAPALGEEAPVGARGDTLLGEASDAPLGLAPRSAGPAASEPGAGDPGGLPYAGDAADGGDLPGVARSTPSRAKVVGYAGVGLIVAVGLALALLAASSRSPEPPGVAHAARRAFDRRAFVSPAGDCVRDLTANSNDPELVSLREAAAKVLVADALAKRYAGRPREAAADAALALELAPSLGVARSLLADLDEGIAPLAASAMPSIDAKSRPARASGSASRPSASASAPSRASGASAGSASPPSSSGRRGATPPGTPPAVPPATLPPAALPTSAAAPEETWL